MTYDTPIFTDDADAAYSAATLDEGTPGSPPPLPARGTIGGLGAGPPPLPRRVSPTLFVSRARSTHMSVNTTAGELRGGDRIRFPDGKGGHHWVPITRAIRAEHNIELLLTVPGAGADYKTLPAAMQVVRGDRVGEAV